MPDRHRQNQFGQAHLLAPTAFSELGSPYGGKAAPDGQRLAIFSSAHPRAWAGRTLPEPRFGLNRLMLFDAALDTCLGVCDGVGHTIHDAAFHPTLPWLAVATGNSDGGYFFGGRTLLWNWETGERRSLFASSRFAVRCRFDDAHRLTVLFTQETDEDDEGHFCTTVQDVLHRSERGPIELAPWACEPDTLGFGQLRPKWPEQEDTWRVLPRLAATAFRPSSGVWDVAWWSDAELAVASTQPALAVHSLAEGTVERYEYPGGMGVQLLNGLDGLNLLHVFVQVDNVRSVGRSRLMAAGRDELTPWQDFDHAYLFSAGTAGTVLGRATGDFHDVVLTEQGRVRTALRLGRYDSFNHALSVRGGCRQYFLTGEAPQPWRDKSLWRLGEHGQEKCMSWDADGQRTHSLAVVCQQERTFVRSSRRSRAGESFDQWFVDLFDVSAGWQRRWTWPATAPVTALAAIQSAPLVIVGTADSTIWMLDAVTGAALDKKTLGKGRTHVIPTAMDVALSGKQVAVGSADGRLWLIDLLVA